MLDDLATLRTGPEAAIAAAADLRALDAVRVAALGKSGQVTALLKGLGAVPAEERKARGAAVNAVKQALEAALDTRRAALEAAALAAALSMLGIMFWFGWIMAERVQFQEMAGLEVSMSWGYAAIPVGAAFAMIGAVAHFLDRRSEELDLAV